MLQDLEIFVEKINRWLIQPSLNIDFELILRNLEQKMRRKSDLTKIW